MPRLHALLRAAGIAVDPATPDPEVASVVYDSRRAEPGALFVAIAGFHVDGHHFAAAAVSGGAVAVVAEHRPEPPLPGGVPLVVVPHARRALSALAAALLGRPSRNLTVAGITGTDGKTTTATLLWSAWRAAGLAAASLTTVDWRCGSDVTPNTTRQTTQEAIELQALLDTFRRRGCTHVALETSSHALALHRVDDVRYRCAVYTRVTSEHLDIHGDRDAYLAAKARLAEMAGGEPDGVVVLDATDDFAYPRLAAIPAATRLTYSADPAVAADVRAAHVQAGSEGMEFDVLSPWGASPVRLRLAGGFNVANALAAITAACATGASLEDAVAGAGALQHVTGRMERVDRGQPFRVVVDYAHTAESLQTVLQELRMVTAGRLWVVFGSAGERDIEKRPAMGAVAARAADAIVITDEDPRGEDRQAILEQIAGGARAGGAVDGDGLWLIADRAEAIAHAVNGAAPGDTVLLAGKGHESSIITATGSIPWSERREAEEAIDARLRAASV
ncbi:MAG TPA: UDP-N-acetylmuramoyl-L-alanyl-D-glutamate--2,6-diaminopimelate ligase [Candidatus Dormibacteraeota bacterium]